MMISVQGVNIDQKTWDTLVGRYQDRINDPNYPLMTPAPSTQQLIAYAVEEHLDASNAHTWTQAEIGGSVDLSQYAEIELAGSTVDLINNVYIPAFALGSMEQALSNILTVHMEAF